MNIIKYINIHTVSIILLKEKNIYISFIGI
jgi:hypothetical protein